MFSAVAEVQSLRPPARAPLYTAFANAQTARTTAPSMLLAVLDEVNHGLVLLTEDADVVFANRVARRDCSADRPMHIDGQRLRLARSADRDALVRALTAARMGRRTMMTIASPDGDMPVGVVPLGDNATSDAVALLILGRHGRSEPLTLQFFAQTHHLTSAERSVVSALCEGLRPTQIAARSGVAISTVRTQISSIRQKTQAKSIGHIVRMIEAMPPIASAQGVPGGTEMGRFVA